MNGAQTNTQGDPVKVQRCQRRSEVIMHCQKQLQEDSKCKEENWLADWIDEIQRADSQCIVKKVHHWKLQVPEETQEHGKLVQVYTVGVGRVGTKMKGRKLA